MSSDCCGIGISSGGAQKYRITETRHRASEKQLASSQLIKLNSIIQSALGYPFQLRFRQWPGELPKTSSGKFEEFVCLVE